MSQEDFPVEFVLESIESIMPSANLPKVLLFDIGGVCVVSPFQAILDYELSHSIPPGWINYSISRLSPNGFWHRLERGEIALSPSFFSGFTSDLHNPSLWTQFYLQKVLPSNSSLSKTTPPLPDIDGEEVFWKMMSTSRNFDPWMYPALQKLRESGRFILAALSNTVIFPDDHEYAHPPPEKDIKRMFDVFISSAHVGLRKPSSEIYALALRSLNEHASSLSTSAIKTPIQPSDIVFLDDIGENLKAAKKAGFRTIKVNLGRTFEAVDELEEVTGMKLAGDHPRVPVKPIVHKKINGEGAKL